MVLSHILQLLCSNFIPASFMSITFLKYEFIIGKGLAVLEHMSCLTKLIGKLVQWHVVLSNLQFSIQWDFLLAKFVMRRMVKTDTLNFMGEEIGTNSHRRLPIGWVLTMNLIIVIIISSCLLRWTWPTRLYCWIKSWYLVMWELIWIHWDDLFLMIHDCSHFDTLW